MEEKKFMASIETNDARSLQLTIIAYLWAKRTLQVWTRIFFKKTHISLNISFKDDKNLLLSMREWINLWSFSCINNKIIIISTSSI